MNSFFPKTIREWNLPQQIVDANSLDLFEEIWTLILVKFIDCNLNVAMFGANLVLWAQSAGAVCPLQ